MFYQKNYQAAANAFRSALGGDLDPKWVEVWSHIYIGKIYDLLGQRERAVNEYSLAQHTTGRYGRRARRGGAIHARSPTVTESTAATPATATGSGSPAPSSRACRRFRAANNLS